MIGLLNESDWKIQKREPYQKYKDYEYVINQALESVQTIGERLNDKELLKDKPKGAIYLSSNHFFEASLELIVFSYSAGEPYRVCRRVNILRDYPDDKIKILPQIIKVRLLSL